jgi:hypothetical protein
LIESGRGEPFSTSCAEHMPIFVLTHDRESAMLFAIGSFVNTRSYDYIQVIRVRLHFDLFTSVV